MQPAGRRPAVRRQRAFTLIELLVAVSILAIVAVLGWRGLDGIVRARVALTEQLEATRGMQLAFAQMQSDCEAVVRPDAVQSRPYLLASNDRMTLVRNVFVENEASRLQVVAYRVVNGVLTRRESLGTRDLAQLDIIWMAMISDTDSNPQVALQSGVNGMQVQTWENGGWRVPGQSGQQQGQPSQPQGGVSAPPQLANAQAPTGLQVSLQLQTVTAPMSKAFLLGGM
ncbi:MAG: type II secretion system protein J [Gammaproteobacteria bacterium]